MAITCGRGCLDRGFWAVRTEFEQRGVLSLLMKGGQRGCRLAVRSRFYECQSAGLVIWVRKGAAKTSDPCLLHPGMSLYSWEHHSIGNLHPGSKDDTASEASRTAQLTVNSRFPSPASTGIASRNRPCRLCNSNSNGLSYPARFGSLGC